MTRTLVVLAVISALCPAILQGCGRAKEKKTALSSRPASTEPATDRQAGTAPPTQPFVQQDFVNRRVINYVSSDPANNSLLSAPPERVTIYFSKMLGAGSFIEVTMEGLNVATGQVFVAQDSRSMYVPVAAGVTGNYKVKYAAYFASGYYEEGSFGFSVKIS